MRLKKVELTGVVTLFYSELCTELGLLPVHDEQRQNMYQHFRKEMSVNGKNPHHLMHMEEIPFQEIINVAYRNYVFDLYINKYSKLINATEIVNLGCGFDTRYFRMTDYHGTYYDVDFQNVIREKLQLISETKNYHMIATRSITKPKFWKQELQLKTKNPVIIAEGIFCYISYPEVAAFVNELFQRYPEAILICDVFLYQKHTYYNDMRSKLLLQFPVYGERIYSLLSRFLKQSGKDTNTRSNKGQSLPNVLLIETESHDTRKEKFIYQERAYIPQFWIGVYKGGGNEV